MPEGLFLRTSIQGIRARVSGDEFLRRQLPAPLQHTPGTTGACVGTWRGSETRRHRNQVAAWFAACV